MNCCHYADPTNIVIIFVVIWCGLRFPFGTKNPFGYIVATVLQYIIVVYAFSVLSSLATLGIGAFLFAVLATKDIIQSMKSIDKSAMSEKRQSKTFKRFSDFILIHSTVKQFSNYAFKWKNQFSYLIKTNWLLRLFMDFSDIFQPLFMAIFSWSLITICITMLMFQTEMVRYSPAFTSDQFFHFIFIIDVFNTFIFQLHGDYFTVILFATIVEACYAFGTVFVVCELSQRASNAFEEIDDKIGETDWYLFPAGIKRMLPTIILNLHQPVVLKCFGSTLCSREAFKMVNLAHKITSTYK